ncbi:MAG: acyl carrier protein [Oscillospiraceae bacterium]|nr:acyl carrier protein [Oscillospiraceae bacterium]
MTFEKIRKALAEQLEVKEDTITMDTNIIDDLGADSLDVVELMMFIEDTFNLAIPDDALHTFRTLGDVVAYVEKNSK